MDTWGLACGKDILCFIDSIIFCKYVKYAGKNWFFVPPETFMAYCNYYLNAKKIQDSKSHHGVAMETSLLKERFYPSQNLEKLNTKL